MGALGVVMILAKLVFSQSSPEGIRMFLNFYAGEDSIVLGAILFFIVASTLFIPLNALIFVVASIFPMQPAVIIIVVGVLGALLVEYLLGYFFSRRAFFHRFLTGFAHFQDALANKGGFLTIFALRLFPILPFSVLSFSAGVMKVRFVDYLAGSVLGVVPGSFLVIVFQNALFNLIQTPSIQDFLIVLLSIVIMVLMSLYMRRRYVLGG